MMPTTYVKSLVCITLTVEDWNLLHELAEDAGESMAFSISSIIEVVLERLKEEADYIDSIGGKAEGPDSDPEEYELPSLFL